MKLEPCLELPPEFGPPLPSEVAKLGYKEMTTAHIVAALKEVGQLEAAQFFGAPEMPAELNSALGYILRKHKNRRFVHAGLAYSASQLFVSVHNRLAWAHSIPDDFKTAWTRFRRWFDREDFLALCQEHELIGYGRCHNGCSNKAAGPSLRTLDKLEKLERAFLCPGLFTHRLRWLLLLRRPQRRIPRGPDGLPLTFTPLLRALWPRGRHLRPALVHQIAARMHPLATSVTRLAYAEELKNRFHHLLYGDGVPRLAEEPVIRTADTLLAAKGALVHAFHAVKRSLHVLGDTVPVQASEACIRDFEAIVAYKEAKPAWLDLHNLNRDSGGWKSPYSRGAFAAFLTANLRESLLPRDKKGLGLPPDEVRIVRMAMFPQKYFFPADEARLKRQKKTERDACSVACYRMFCDLVRDGGLYAQTGDQYYADPTIAEQLPTAQVDREMAHLPGVPLPTLEARWHEQRRLALDDLRVWRRTWHLSRDISNYARRAEPLFAVTESIPISVIWLLLKEAWTALPSVESRKVRAVWMRDLLIVEFLASKAPRRRTLREMTVNYFSQKGGDVYRANVPDHTTKNNRAWKGRLRNQLSIAVARYLKEARPVLAGDQKPIALFLTNAGKPFASDAEITARSIAVTKVLLGSGMNPHAFRYLLATSLLVAGFRPKAVAELLMIAEETLLYFYRVQISPLQQQVNTRVWKHLARHRQIHSGILPSGLKM